MNRIECVLIFLCTLLVFLNPVHANEEKQIKLGAYINELRDFHYEKKEFTADLHVWFIHSELDRSLKEFITVSNAKSQVITSHKVKRTGNNVWEVLRISAVVVEDWNLTDYPFDKHNLKIIIEYFDLNNSNIKLVPDEENSHIHPEFFLNDWRIVGFDIERSDSSYLTNYGNPNNDSRVSRNESLVLSILIERLGWVRFFADYIGFIVAFFLMSFSLITEKGKYGMIGASIFSTIGNKYIVDSRLPLTSHMSFNAAIQMISFIGIIFLSLLTVLLEVIENKGFENLAQKIRWIVFPLYMGVVLGMVAYVFP